MKDKFFMASMSDDTNVTRQGLSLVIPAFNEEESIAKALTEACDAFEDLHLDYEVIVVDDGSRDLTAKRVEEFAATNDRVRLIRFISNRGYGRAIETGFKAATKDLIAFTDADCQFDLTEIDRLVFLARDYDIVSGYRIDRKDPWLRKFYSAGYNALIRILFGFPLRDCDCALKVFRREALESIEITGEGFTFNAELITRAKMADLRIVEVGVSHRPRVLGQSTVSIKYIPPVLSATLRLWWNLVLFPGPKAGAPLTQVVSVAGSGHPSRSFPLVLLLLCILLLSPGLNSPLFDPDESRYSQIAMNMLDSGDWITPRLDGVPYLDKPPLLYWLTAASFAMLGESAASARLPVAVATTLTIFAMFYGGRKILGDVSAFTAAMCVILSSGFMLCGRFLIMDGLLTLFTTASALSFAIGTEKPDSKQRWLLLAGLFCGLGFLTKGLAATIVCIPPVVLYLFLIGERTRLSVRDVALYFMPAIAICLPWIILTAVNNQDFVYQFFWRHHFVRFTSAFNHEQPWWFFIPVILLSMCPFILFLPTIIGHFVRLPMKARQKLPSIGGFFALSAVWVVLFYSVSACKLPPYILPAIPLFCLFIGPVAASLMREIRLGSGLANLRDVIARRVACGVGIPLFALSIVIAYFNTNHLIFAALLMIVSFVSMFGLFVSRNSIMPGFIASWGAILFFVFVGEFSTLSVLVPDFSLYRQRNKSEIMQVINDRKVDDLVFIESPPNAFKVNFPSIEYSVIDLEQAVCIGDPPYSKEPTLVGVPDRLVSKCLSGLLSCAEPLNVPDPKYDFFIVARDSGH